LILNYTKNIFVKLRKYFSGKLILTQIIGGIGAFSLRSLAAYYFQDRLITAIVLSLIGSFLGYIIAYIFGYWLLFRKDYQKSGRSMIKDVAWLQLVEQIPNMLTIVLTGFMQGFLVQYSGVGMVVSANLASWFGPQKIINLLTLIASNMFKKGFIDKTWGASLGKLAVFKRNKNITIPDADLIE
jgi:Na+/H+-dicarboxylate symporter